MNETLKQKFLQWAEIIDSLRIFPRLFLLSCFWWAVIVTRDLLTWYTMLAKDERGIEASGFASIALLAVLGFLKLVYSTYSAAGRAWGAASTSSSTVVATTTETTQP